jgi:hypothetical protein
LLACLLIPWSRVLLEKLTGFKLVKKFPAFYRICSFITAVAIAATCPYLEPARSSPHRTAHFLKVHLNIILSSTPGSRNWSISFRFPHQNLVNSRTMESVFIGVPVGTLQYRDHVRWGAQCSDDPAVVLIKLCKSFPSCTVSLRQPVLPESSNVQCRFANTHRHITSKLLNGQAAW